MLFYNVTLGGINNSDTNNKIRDTRYKKDGTDGWKKELEVC